MIRSRQLLFSLLWVALALANGRVLEAPPGDGGSALPDWVLEHPPTGSFMEELTKSDDPRINLDVPQLANYYNYHCDVHTVNTADGYILTLHRLSTNGSESTTCKELPGKCQSVLLQHGLLSSASTWIMNFPEKALGYMLADLGYDVWLGNARGSNYSIAHVSLDLKSFAYWDFSFHEMGKFDLPAVIDYIQTFNPFSQMHYVGHSMGTTMFWIMENEHPGYASKNIASMSALGPVAYVGAGSCPMKLLAPFSRELDDVVRHLMHVYQLFKPNAWITKIVEGACIHGNMTDWICSNSLFLLVGFDGHDLDYSWLPTIMKQLNAGASSKTIIHYGQLMHDKLFQAYDYYSKRANKDHYGTETPPTYSLAMVKVPVMLKWGMNDPLADPTDVVQLAKEMTGVSELLNSPVSNPKFSHMDFLWGKDADKLVYADVIDWMSKHAPSSE